MDNYSKNLWADFKTYFAQSCEFHFSDALEKAWFSSGDRTSFYKNIVFPEIAKKLSMKVRFELFKVDAALCKTSISGHDVPVIFIESENNAASATHEMWKLCSVNAACKILIVCCEWSMDLWQHSGRQDHLIEEWNKIVKSHAEIWKSNGIVGVINAESGSVFRLTSAAWDEDGILFEKPNTFFQRDEE